MTGSGGEYALYRSRLHRAIGPQADLRSAAFIDTREVARGPGAPHRRTRALSGALAFWAPFDRKLGLRRDDLSPDR